MSVRITTDKVDVTTREAEIARLKEVPTLILQNASCCLFFTSSCDNITLWDFWLDSLSRAGPIWSTIGSALSWIFRPLCSKPLPPLDPAPVMSQLMLLAAPLLPLDRPLEPMVPRVSPLLRRQEATCLLRLPHPERTTPQWAMEAVSTRLPVLPTTPRTSPRSHMAALAAISTYVSSHTLSPVLQINFFATNCIYKYVF